MAKVDLHLHSLVSDGVLSPSELVDKAVSLGLTAISLTDHDNVDGILPAMEAARNYPSLAFIPGVEISTDTEDGEVHMLGYFIDYTDRNLLAVLHGMRQSRVTRAQKMVAKLKDLGVPVEWERVQELAGTGSVGRPHIAQALLEKEFIASTNEAFTKYLAFDGPAYVHRDKMTPTESIDLILKARGIPVMAHPLTKASRDPEKMIAWLVKAGLAGLEAYYKNYPPEDRSYLVKLAEKYGLIVTGGTDYHGLDENYEIMMGEADVPPGVVDSLTKLHNKTITI